MRGEKINLNVKSLKGTKLKNQGVVRQISLNLNLKGWKRTKLGIKVRGGQSV